jgi:hypothetical protein
LDAVAKDRFVALAFQQSGFADWPVWRNATGKKGAIAAILYRNL